VFWRVLQDNLGLLVTCISFCACFSIFQSIATCPIDWRDHCHDLARDAAQKGP